MWRRPTFPSRRPRSGDVGFRGELKRPGLSLPLMCGIAGFVGAGDGALLRRMTDAIRHRGPDAEGHWIDEKTGVFLGHRRLSIVDLSGGAQPMWTRDGD